MCASRFWFNYRHVANTLSVYRSVRRLGVPDSNIILMLAENVACDARNPAPGVVFNHADHALDLYGSSVEVDYRGAAVSVEALLRVLTGRHEPHVPRSQRLLSDAASHVLVYVTGHGGDGFLKFQDSSEVTGVDLAGALAQMAAKRRYRRLLFLADTCQAATLAAEFSSPGVLALASSAKGEPSWSHSPDGALGLTVVDRFTHYLLAFLEHVAPGSDATLAQLFGSLDAGLLRSTPTARMDLFPQPLEEVLVTDFFGAATRQLVLTPGAYPR